MPRSLLGDVRTDLTLMTLNEKRQRLMADCFLSPGLCCLEYPPRDSVNIKGNTGETMGHLLECSLDSASLDVYSSGIPVRMVGVKGMKKEALAWTLVSGESTVEIVRC